MKKKVNYRDQLPLIAVLTAHIFLWLSTDPVICSSSHRSSSLYATHFVTVFVMSANILLSMRFEDDWKDLLTIPKSEIAQFSLRPLKWLTFVGYAISGTTGKLSSDGTTTIGMDDLDSNQPLADRYYYIFDGAVLLFLLWYSYIILIVGEPQFVDPRGCDERTSFGSQAQYRNRSLRSRVLNRDGHCCVLTNACAEQVQASHLLPHACGNDVRVPFSQIYLTECSTLWMWHDCEATLNNHWTKLMTLTTYATSSPWHKLSTHYWGPSVSHFYRYRWLSGICLDLSNI